MRILWIVALIAVSTTVHSQSSQDVIYKKDGSILRGVIIEQDFNNNIYKIQLAGGSIFVVQGEDLERISKENIKQHNPTYQTEPNFRPASEANPVEVNPHYFPTAYQAKPITNTQHVVYIGTLSHNIAAPYLYDNNLSVEYNYTGIKLAVQKNHDQHIATHYTLNIGTLSSVELVNDDNEVLAKDDDFDPQNYLGLSAAVIASTNLQYGWQFFTGGGINHDEYSFVVGETTHTGLSLELGLGYAWTNAQAILRYQTYLLHDYPDELDIDGINFEMGFHF